MYLLQVSDLVGFCAKQLSCQETPYPHIRLQTQQRPAGAGTSSHRQSACRRPCSVPAAVRAPDGPAQRPAGRAPEQVQRRQAQRILAWPGALAGRRGREQREHQPRQPGAAAGHPAAAQGAVPYASERARAAAGRPAARGSAARAGQWPHGAARPLRTCLLVRVGPCSL